MLNKQLVTGIAVFNERIASKIRYGMDHTVSYDILNTVNCPKWFPKSRIKILFEKCKKVCRALFYLSGDGLSLAKVIGTKFGDPVVTVAISRRSFLPSSAKEQIFKTLKKRFFELGLDFTKK